MARLCELRLYLESVDLHVELQLMSRATVHQPDAVFKASPNLHVTWLQHATPAEVNLYTASNQHVHSKRSTCTQQTSNPTLPLS